MNRSLRVLLSVAFVGAVLSQSAHAQSGTEAAGRARSTPPTQQQALYLQGTKAMDEQRWSDAVTAFDQLASGKNELSDAGLYWKAYSLEKLGRRDESLATCDTLAKQQSMSPWNRECLILRTRSLIDVSALTQLALQSAKLDAIPLRTPFYTFSKDVQLAPFSPLRLYSNHPASEDDIKILALNSLIRQDPAKAMPILRDFLKSDKPASIREQGLFVLSLSKDPQAQALLADTAMGKGDPRMQRKAIELLSVSRGKDANPTLVDIYRSSTDAAIKRAALNGLFLTHDGPRLVDLARGEKDLNMKREIVSQLSLMDDKAANDYMLELLR
jgi:tetratricopeptide (TPR) repeat protein